MTNDTAHTKCGLSEFLLFVGAIVTGTACSICSKTMMQLPGQGITGEMEVFEKPLFQTAGMFVGMLFGLVMHVVVLVAKIPFPGYTVVETRAPDALPTEHDALINNDKKKNETATILSTPLWMYFFLMIPALFDLAATALCMMGLRYLNVSIYQMLRGSGIIFVALMKQHVLRHRLYNFQWWGVAWNVVSVFMVGATALLQTSESSDVPFDEALWGVVLVLLGALVQALQFVFEEKVMTMDDAAPPLLLIGMEGLWGTLFCVGVLYPIAYYLPGNDHGSYEDPFNTWYMLTHDADIQIAFVLYFVAIFMYNLLAVLVTFQLNSVWHAILDNFRPITVWGTDLFIFYMISAAFGEPWTGWSWLQVLGMGVLLYGTAIYNAPNAGSLSLRGQWWAFGLNYASEYHEIEQKLEEERVNAEWIKRKETFNKRRSTGSFAGEWLGTPRM